MPGAGFKDFQAGEKLRAADVDNYLMQQSVMRFANSAARGSTIGTAVAEGMMSYLDDTNSVEAYNGSTWVPVGGGASSPNYILNADMSINQRGFSSNTAGNGPGMMIDMWRGVGSGGSLTYSVQSLSPAAIPVAQQGSQHLRVAVTGLTTSTQYAVIWQKIENARLLAGQTVTVSFWAKSVSGTAKMASNMLRHFGTGGSPSASEFVIEAQTFDITTSWARYSYTATIPSDSGKTYGTNNDSYLQVEFTIAAGTGISQNGGVGITDRTTDIWGVQIEQGATATTFRTNQPNRQAELAACQRYYFRQRANSTNTYAVFGTGHANTTTAVSIAIPMKVTMRAAPTVSSSGSFQVLSGGNTSSMTPVAAADQISVDMVAISGTVSGFTAGQATFLRANNDANAYIDFSAEL